MQPVVQFFENYILVLHDQLMTQASHNCHEFITHTRWSSLHRNGNNTPATKQGQHIIVASTSDGKHIITATHDLQQ